MQLEHEGLRARLLDRRELPIEVRHINLKNYRYTRTGTLSLRRFHLPDFYFKRVLLPTDQPKKFIGVFAYGRDSLVARLRVEDTKVVAKDGFAVNAFSTKNTYDSLAVKGNFIFYCDGSDVRKYNMKTGDSKLIFEGASQFHESDYLFRNGELSPPNARIRIAKDGSLVVFGAYAYVFDTGNTRVGEAQDVGSIELASFHKSRYHLAVGHKEEARVVDTETGLKYFFNEKDQRYLNNSRRTSVLKSTDHVLSAYSSRADTLNLSEHSHFDLATLVLVKEKVVGPK